MNKEDKNIKNFKRWIDSFLKSKGVLRLLIGNIISEQFRQEDKNE